MEALVPYATPVTTDELISVYDQLNESEHVLNKHLHSLDKVLANLQGTEDECKDQRESAALDDSKTRSTEDLLAILEGDGDGDEVKHDKPPLDRATEKALALKQLKEMPKGKRKTPKASAEIVDVQDVNIPAKRPPKPVHCKAEKISGDISFIVQDWSDGEAPEKSSDENDKPESIVQNGKSHSDEVAQKAVEPTKRVIKKKIIWDPDNSTTFKLAGKASPNRKINNNLETVQTKLTKHFAVKDKPPNGEKPDENQTKSEKLNSSTLNSTRKKKMSEVDKLLMDEGAVNMIYQLERSNNNVDVPEIVLKPNSKSMVSKSKEKKNLLNKTRIIKNAVFRVSKSNDVNERITVIRTRREQVKKTFKKPESAASLRNSVQSPPHGDDSAADESRIIRRHSSSSFSSGCLSPRPQSPSGLSTGNDENNAANSEQMSSLINDSGIPDLTSHKIVRSAKSTNKLKRKYSNGTNKNVQNKKKWVNDNKIDTFTEISMKIVENVASIVIKPSSNECGLFDIKVLQELTFAVYSAIESKVQVISLTSQDGLLCGGLDLRSLLQKRPAQQRTNTNCFLDTLRELVIQLSKFKGAIVTGVDGACSSFGIVLLSLSDFVLVSSRATFCLSPAFRSSLPTEGLSVFNQSCSLPAKLINELLLLGRVLTASEALSYNMITRVCDPNDFSTHFGSFVKEISHSSMEVFEIHKSTSCSEEKLNEALEKECTLLSEYWCTPSGQDVIQLTHSNL